MIARWSVGMAEGIGDLNHDGEVTVMADVGVLKGR